MTVTTTTTKLLMTAKTARTRTSDHTSASRPAESNPGVDSVFVSPATRRSRRSIRSHPTPLNQPPLASLSASQRRFRHPRKRGPVDSDDEYIDSSISLSQSLGATRSRRQKHMPTDAAGSPIEISGSSEEDTAPAARRAQAWSSVYARIARSESTQGVQLAARCASTSQGADLELIPEIEPPPEFVAAFRILWTARREVSQPFSLVAKASFIQAVGRYSSSVDIIKERDVLSDSALLALAVHQPLGPYLRRELVSPRNAGLAATDYAAFTTVLGACEEKDPSLKWTSYGAYFRTVLRSMCFRAALPASTSSFATT